MQKSPLITFVIGTRPEAIKLAVLILKFKAERSLRIRLILTGQHKEMLNQALNSFGILGDSNLEIMSKNQSLSQITSLSLNGLDEEFSNNKPDLLITQGDTSTAFSAALSAFYRKIPIGHVEAGLRTNNLFDPYPEEANRRLISQLATLHFSPTKDSVNNLKDSGIMGSIYLTGNTVVDSLLEIEKKIPDNFMERFNLKTKDFILVTMHRRENWGKNLEDIISGLKKVIDVNRNISLFIPVHLNSIVREPILRSLGGISRVKLTDPLKYEDMVGVLKNCKIVLTDSGGLQEEAPTFGKPVLILRKTTERLEAIKAGTAKLIGTNSITIFKEVQDLLLNQKNYDQMSQLNNPFGDGNSSEKIIQICKDFLNLSNSKK